MAEPSGGHVAQARRHEGHGLVRGQHEPQLGCAQDLGALAQRLAVEAQRDGVVLALVAHARHEPACMLAFAAVFQDADLAQRIVLGPGLLLVVVAVSITGRSTARWLEPSLRLEVVLSAAQIVRSVLLYLAREPVG